MTHDICHRTRTKKPKFETSSNTIKSAYNRISVGVFQMHFRAALTAYKILVNFALLLFVRSLFLDALYTSFASNFGSSIIPFPICVPSQTAICKEIHYKATQKYHVEKKEINNQANP